MGDWVLRPFRWLFYRPRQHHFDYKVDHWHNSHAGLFGQTESGKSTLLTTLYHSELEAIPNSSSVLIDPHGDLAKRLFRLNTDKELVYISPTLTGIDGQSGQVVMNPFDHGLADAHFIDQEYRALSLAEALHELMPDISSNMLVLLNACCLTLMSMKNVDLRDLVRFLDDRNMSPYLQFAQCHLHQDMLKRFLSHHFVAAKRTRDAVAYRLMGMLSTSRFAGLVCGKTTLSLSKALNEQTHLLFDLSSLPRVSSDAFGKLLLGQLKSLYLSRAIYPNRQRQRIRLWLDEAPRFIGPSFAEILQESRKFGLVVTFASQSYVQNLKPTVKEAIRTNTTIKITGSASHQSLSAFANDTQADIDHLHKLNRHRFYYHYQHQKVNLNYTFNCPRIPRRSKAWISQAEFQQRQTDLLKRYYKCRDRLSSPPPSTADTEPYYPEHSNSVNAFYPLH